MSEMKLKMDVLETLTNAVSGISDEAMLKVRKEGISLEVIDKQKVTFVNVVLSKEAFESFDMPKCDLGLSFVRIKKFLRLVKPEDVVTFVYEPKKKRISLQVKELTQRMSLKELNINVPNLRSFDFKTDIEMETETLKKVIRMAENVASEILFTASPDNLTFSSENQMDKVEMFIPGKELKNFKCEELLKSLYATEYLSMIVKAINKAENITISFGNDVPLKLVFDFANGYGTVMLMLAPRMRDDSE